MDLKSLVTTVAPFSVNERRSIWEVANNVPLLRIQAFAFYDSRTSGANHYHRLLTEYFFVIKGIMTKLVLEDVHTRDRMIFTDLGAGSLIVVPPFIAHANCFSDGTVMLAGCSTAHDENDDDVYHYQLLDHEGKEVIRR